MRQPLAAGFSNLPDSSGTLAATGLQSSRGVCASVVYRRFGELEFVAEVVTETEVPVTPRLAHDVLR